MDTLTLTIDQLQLLSDVLGDDTDFPRRTEDPLVNYAVDRITACEGDEPLPSFEEVEHLYVAENAAVETHARQ